MNKRKDKILYSMWLTKEEAEILEAIINLKTTIEDKNLLEIVIKRGDIQKK